MTPTRQVREQVLPQDVRQLLSIVRTAASRLILSSSVNEAIDLLRQDPLELAAVDYVSNWALSDREIDAALRGGTRKINSRRSRIALLSLLLLLDRAV